MGCVSAGGWEGRKTVTFLVGVAFTVLFAGGALAGPPSFTVKAPSCIPEDENAAVIAVIEPATGWGSVRTYFRRAGTADYYFLEMRTGDGGQYWAVLPKPDNGTTAVELFIAVKNADGEESRSALQKIAVTSKCKITPTLAELSFAHNLVVGETVVAQKGGGVLGFLCEGIISRIDYAGELRTDDYCCRELMLLAANKSTLLPFLLIGGTGGGITILRHHEGIIRHTEPEEASPPRP